MKLPDLASPAFDFGSVASSLAGAATRSQTVHDVPVLTVWDVDTLRAELAQPGPCFDILPNSRSLPAEKHEPTRRVFIELLCLIRQFNA